MVVWIRWAAYKFHIFNRNIYFHDFYKNYSLYIVWFVEWSNLYDFLSNGISEILPRSITKKSFKERSLIISLYKFKGANWSLDRWLHHLHCPPGCPVSSETICCWICCSQRARQSEENRSSPWQRALFEGRDGELDLQERLSLGEAFVGSRPTWGRDSSYFLL